MQGTPTVSVIIPTRNRAHVLRRSIESVLDQTIRNLELLVIDDASDDHTEFLVRSITDPRIRYIRSQSHRGAPAARNMGISETRGAYLAFQDSDDEWLPNKLERQLQLLDRYAESADVATCGTIRMGSEGRPRISVAGGDVLSYTGLLAYEQPPWGSQTILVRRTPYTSPILFDEALASGQDWDYVVRLAKVTNVVSVREPLVVLGSAGGDRISTSRRKLQGTRQLRAKYDETLQRYPKALLSHEVRLSVLSMACGEFADGRHHVMNALRIDPFQPRLVALALASFVRQPALRSFLKQWVPGSGLSRALLKTNQG